jgi:hypothetical protein
MAITANTLVPTPNGWERADKIFKDSLLFTERGELTQANLVQVYTPKECFEVEFDDGLTICGDKNLTFYLQNAKWRSRLSQQVHWKNRKFQREMTRPLLIKKLEELNDNPLKDHRGRLIYSVPNSLPVQYPNKDLPVPPYIFGVWFATLSPTGRHWLRGQPFNKMQKIFRGYGHFIKTRKHKNGDVLFDIRPSVRDSFLFAGCDIPTSIPFYYLDSDVDQRIELLQGLVDGGLIKKSKSSSVYTATDANYRFLRKLQGLVESLGIKTTLSTPHKNKSYKLKFRLIGNFPINYGINRRFVIKINKISPQPCVHIDTGTQFLVNEGFIPVC